VPRWRLRIDHKPDEGAAGGGEGGEWQLLYAGPETSYEVQGLVPTYALAQEVREKAVREPVSPPSFDNHALHQQSR